MKAREQEEVNTRIAGAAAQEASRGGVPERLVLAERDHVAHHRLGGRRAVGWALRVSNCQMPKAAERVCAREHAPAGREAAARQRLRQLRRGYSIKDATQPWSALCVVRANTTHAALALAPFAAPARTVGARRGRRSSLAEAAEQLGARHRASAGRCAGRCAEALRWCTADARGATTAFSVTAPSIAAGPGTGSLCRSDQPPYVERMN